MNQSVVVRLNKAYYQSFVINQGLKLFYEVTKLPKFVACTRELLKSGRRVFRIAKIE